MNGQVDRIKAKNYFYICINTEEKYTLTTGLGFQCFYDSIPSKIKNILLLDNAFSEAVYDHKISMEYANEKTMPLLYNDKVYNYGNFCWIDYKYDDSKSKLTKQELAELLYINHYKKPLNSPFFKTLENEYVYLAHDDDWWTKIYMRNISNTKDIIQHKIKSELKGKKREMSNIQENVLQRIYHDSLKGVIFDFERANSCGVTFYTVGEINSFSYDDIHNSLDKMRGKTATEGGYLEYNSRKKTWVIYD